MTARSAVLMLSIEADFADLFSVKRGALDNHLGGSPGELGELAFVDDSGDLEMVVESSVEGARGGGVTVWPVTLEPGGSWTTCIEVSVRVKGEPVVPLFRCGQDTTDPSTVTHPGPWFADAPQVECSDDRVERLWNRSVADLGSLVLADAHHPADPYVAAGAPWFMTLYGRDSLWAGWMALPCGNQLLLGVMRTLARLQGRNLVFDTEENPGRILHEVRAGSSGSDAIDDADIYYGSTDVTPLFVIMAGELLRWGASRDDLAGLLPAVDHAIHWIEQYGDLTGDGFIETQRTSPTGLINQGWKDSWDSVSFANGRLAGLPVALIEVQSYVYAAYRARAELARFFDDDATAANCDFKADAMRERVIHEFWLGDEDGLALARDPDGQRVDAVASNQGHALWAGLLDGEHSAVVARRLMSDDMFSGFGLRTLATGMGRYDPVSYHNGSVWPHDTAITAVGLARNGFHKDALRLVEGLVAASSDEDGRLPELFSGLSRRDVDSPVPYPTSCSPQAWAAGAGLLLVRLLAGIEPELHLGRVSLSPLWQGPGTLEIDELRLGDHTIDLVIDDNGSAEVIGASAELTFDVAR
jgi:glycogen debranching enzyme